VAQVSHSYNAIGRIITLYRVSLDLIETSLDFNIFFNPKKHLLAEISGGYTGGDMGDRSPPLCREN